MLKQDKLESFLDIFFDGKNRGQEVDLDFWQEEEQDTVPEKEGF